MNARNLLALVPLLPLLAVAPILSGCGDDDFDDVFDSEDEDEDQDQDRDRDNDGIVDDLPDDLPVDRPGVRGLMNPTRAWIDLMILHHEMELSVLGRAARFSDREDVVGVAEALIEDQRDELAELRELREDYVNADDDLEAPKGLELRELERGENFDSLFLQGFRTQVQSGVDLAVLGVTCDDIDAPVRDFADEMLDEDLDTLARIGSLIDDLGNEDGGGDILD